ncbi:MAG: hypothetical protein J0L54_08380 [Chitinophagales bacterium]|nr:hypothetical protein [Chitinophagales bacterium]
MDEKVQLLQRQVNKLKLLVAAICLSAILFFILAFGKREENESIIRVKGIIVEDEAGRERIIIGAPLPFAKNRARTDTAKIKSKWAIGMGPQYMNNYKTYNHSANGIAILDENGWDRIVLVDPVPDPIIGNRIGPETGLLLNDDKGLERSGYGLLNVNNQLRVVLGPDHGNGMEGAALSVLPDGSVGLYLDSKDNSIFAGHVKADHWKSPNKKVFTGITLHDSTGKKIIIPGN